MRISEIPGLNLAADPYEVGLKGLVTGINIDLSKNRKPSRRAGRTLAYEGTIIAAWGDGEDCIFLEGTDLKRLFSNYTAETLRSGLTDPTYLTACRAYNRLYWNTNADSGVLEGSVERAWGLPRPTTPIPTQAAIGNLPSGRYLVAMAYVTASGEEGPLSEHALFVGQTGISLSVPTNIPARAERINLYISTLNGKVLYLAASYLAGATVLIYIGDGSDLSIPADNQHRDVLPLGSRLVYYAGRLWTQLPNMLVFTDEYSEHTDLRENFIPFPSRLNDFGAVDDGLFVATANETFFFSGRDPRQMEPIRVAPYGATPGTFTRVSGRILGEGVDQEALMWISPRGVCAGLPGGTLLNLTERQVNQIPGQKGTAILRQANGQSHFLAIIQN